MTTCSHRGPAPRHHHHRARARSDRHSTADDVNKSVVSYPRRTTQQQLTVVFVSWLWPNCDKGALRVFGFGVSRWARPLRSERLQKKNIASNTYCTVYCTTFVLFSFSHIALRQSEALSEAHICHLASALRTFSGVRTCSQRPLGRRQDNTEPNSYARWQHWAHGNDLPPDARGASFTKKLRWIRRSFGGSLYALYAVSFFLFLLSMRNGVDVESGLQTSWCGR